MSVDMSNPQPAEDFEYDDTVECWQCYGVGMVAGCFEDCCSGADCDPEDAEYCCAPSRCDVCNGKGGWPLNPETDD